MKGAAGDIVRPPGFGGVAATGVAENIVPDTQSWDAAAQIAVRQRGAPVPQTDVTIPPTAPPIQSGQRVSVETSVTRATIPIVPTLYPGEPATGAIIVQNFITINTGSVEFRDFNEKFGELIEELHRSNELAGEVREKLIAEMAAGRTILQSPKPDPKLIDLLLKRPLSYIAGKAGGAAIGTLASAALMALLKLIGVL